jgi:hypothetical protein
MSPRFPLMYLFTPPRAFYYIFAGNAAQPLQINKQGSSVYFLPLSAFRETSRRLTPLVKEKIYK